MGRDSGRFRQEIIDKLKSCGAVAVGFAAAGEISESEASGFDRWIGEGCHAGMEYLERHAELRRHTSNVLEGAKTVISLAFSYGGSLESLPKEADINFRTPVIASYALGKDYHKVIRKRLKEALTGFKNDFGGDWRLCIDSAPVAERYWAVKSGIGERSANGNVVIPGYGSMCFLAEILTTIEIEKFGVALNNDLSGNRESRKCADCGACRRSCLTGALREDGTIDARRCLNYLTIEHRGEWSEEQKRLVEKGKAPVFGCDRCLRACPLNRDICFSDIEEFAPTPIATSIIDAVSKGNVEKLYFQDEQAFRQAVAGTPLSRLKFPDFIRNLNYCRTQSC